MNARHRIGIVGAGYISDIHAEALASVADLTIAALVEPNRERATAFAEKWHVERVFNDVDALLGADCCTAAHVLVPPPLHRRVAEPILKSGINVFLEKPMATSAADCAALNETAAGAGAILGINQNFIFHPSFCKLKQTVESRRLGGLHHLVAVFNVPLRQLAAGQVDHWMFQHPRNILLEQAVHPLSQIRLLTGPIDKVSVLTSEPRMLAPGLPFAESWQISLNGADATAQIFLSFGQDYPVWRLSAVCQDGVVSADMFNETVVFDEATRWPDFYDSLLNGLEVAKDTTLQSVRNAAAYVGATLKLAPRSDPFFQSMRGSIRQFYAELGVGTITANGLFGEELVALCDRIADSAGLPEPSPPKLVEKTTTWDVAVLGGTGFIGRHLVRELLARDYRVAVMARKTDVLAPPLDDPRVAVLCGDIGRQEDVARATDKARFVINLAQGASGTSDDEIIHSMIASATAVAEACLQGGGKPLIHASTIAALYLGDAGDTVTGDTPTDAKPHKRAGYGRGKAASEKALSAMAHDKGLRLCIVRPGVVIGGGGIPFHSGIGFFNRERHCMGWNHGKNPLPFVLVEDVAQALALLLEKPDVFDGRSYNLVGDVRLTAAEYFSELAHALGRPLKHHGQSVVKLQGVELFKWLVKRASGRRDAAFPSYRDLKSRGMMARFDCNDIKQTLGWRPTHDRVEFIKRGIQVHGRDGI